MAILPAPNQDIIVFSRNFVILALFLLVSTDPENKRRALIDLASQVVEIIVVWTLLTPITVPHQCRRLQLISSPSLPIQGSTILVRIPVRIHQLAGEGQSCYRREEASRTVWRHRASRTQRVVLCQTRRMA